MVILLAPLAAVALSPPSSAQLSPAPPSTSPAPGMVVTDFGLGEEGASAVAIQSDGGILLVLHADDLGQFGVARYTSAGSIDQSFGDGGKVITGFDTAGEYSLSVAIQPDGRFVVAGETSEDFALARYLPTGSLDPSFGKGGKVTTDFGSNFDEGAAVAIQPDGKIVVAGVAGRQAPEGELRPGERKGISDFALARYMPNGSLDRSFGHKGKVTTDFNSFDAVATAVGIQPDGRIAVAGAVGTLVRLVSDPKDPSSGPLVRYEFALARYTPDGSLDRSFGSDGMVTTEFSSAGHHDGRKESGDPVEVQPGGWGHAMAIQTDGKILVAGDVDAPTFDDFALARYTPTGSLDRSFGRSGKVTTDFRSKRERGQAVGLEPDGKIVVAGSVSGDFALARYTPTGSLDRSFGSAGKVITDFGSAEFPQALAIQRDGEVVVAGRTFTNLETMESVVAMARYTTTGSLDQGFNAGGPSPSASPTTRLGPEPSASPSSSGRRGVLRRSLVGVAILLLFLGLVLLLARRRKGSSGTGKIPASRAGQQDPPDRTTGDC
jgi:uncharacterized delta-60 repeat protein